MALRNCKPRMYRAFVLAALLGILGTHPARASERDASEPADEPVTFESPARSTADDATPGIYRLDGTRLDLPQDDLRPLRRVIGRARYVGLGESIHTSGGYYEMKSRVFRFLVEHMGFRILAFESPWDAADSVNHYVETCDGSADAAIHGLFGVWQSAEVRDLLRWMCEWNQAHSRPADRVHFYGFDIQQPTHDGPALMEFLERIGLAPDDDRVTGIARCDSVFSLSNQSSPVPQEDYDRCIGALDAVEHLFSENARTIIRKTSRRDLEWAKLRRLGLEAWENQRLAYSQEDYLSAFAFRDRAMSQALQTVRHLRFPGNPRTAVWAHNVHVSKARPDQYPPTMGVSLKQSLGDAYVSIGLVSLYPATDWPGSAECATFGPRSRNSVESILANRYTDYLLVDLHTLGGYGPLIDQDTWRYVGDLLMIPSWSYDGLIYLKNSPAMTPLAWPSCASRQAQSSSDNPGHLWLEGGASLLEEMLGSP